MTLPCVDCGAPIDRKPRGPKPKRCPPCAKRVDREKRAERHRDIEADRALVRSVAENLREYVTPDMWARVEDYVAAIGVRPNTEPPLVPDRMPDGTLSDAGPDEGTSTNWTDLAADLEQRRMSVIMHEWFADNPRWLDGVND